MESGQLGGKPSTGPSVTLQWSFTAKRLQSLLKASLKSPQSLLKAVSESSQSPVWLINTLLKQQMKEKKSEEIVLQNGKDSLILRLFTKKRA